MEQGGTNTGYHKCRAVGQGGGVGIYHLLPTLFWSEVAHLGEPRFVVAGNRQDTDLPHGILLGRGQRYGQAAIAHRPWSDESEQYGEQLLYRHSATVHQCGAGLRPDVCCQLLCGLGGTLHRSDIFLHHLSSGQTHEGRTKEYLQQSPGR